MKNTTGLNPLIGTKDKAQMKLEMRNATKSKEQMKKDWGPQGTTMKKKLGK